MKVWFPKSTPDVQERRDPGLQDIFLWLKRQFFYFNPLFFTMLSHFPIEVLKIAQKGCKSPSGDLSVPKGGIGLLLPGWLLVLGLETFPSSFANRVAKSNELFAVSSTPEQI